MPTHETHEMPAQPQPAATEPDAPRTRRRTTRSTPLLIAAAVALVLVLIAVIWHTSSSGHTTASSKPGSASASVTSAQYAAAGVSTVDLNGISGTLTVSVGNSPQISATAQPTNGHAAPDLALRWNAASHALTLTCSTPNNAPVPGASAVAITCPDSTYTVLLPAHVGVTLHEISGQTTLDGLSGPISITASSADTTAQALNTPDFTAAIISGTLNAAFTTAPTHLSVSVTSAQASLQLPANTSYAIHRQTVSADIQVAVPQSPTSPHTVQLSATSGDINLGTSN